MKINTGDLSGAALDWAVIRAINVGTPWRYWGQAITAYSTNWAHGGPIIEREGIAVREIAPIIWNDGMISRRWIAEMFRVPGKVRKALGHGPTPLIAAMRCYVASKLGNEVDVPDCLL